MMLWNVGSIYVLLLLTFLVVGFGIGAYKLLETTGEALLAGNNPQKGKKGGGNSNIPSSLSIATMAFTGIILAYFALGLSTVNSSENHDHAAHAAQQGSQQANPVVNSQSAPQTTGPTQTMNEQIHELDMQLGTLESNLGN